MYSVSPSFFTGLALTSHSNLTPQLRAFVFGFYSDKDAPEKLTECYTFHVKYPKEDGTEFDLAIEQGGDAFAALRSKDGISTATKQMLGNLLEKVRSLKVSKFIPESSMIT